MIATARTTGKAFANDPDYDALSGRVVDEYTVRREDKRRGCVIWTTYQVIDIGRADRVQPRDVDAELGAEKLEYDKSDRMAGLKRAAGERDILLGETIQAHMRRVGPPVKAALLVSVTGVSLATVQRHLQRHSDVYFIVGRYRGWGLVGIHE